MRYKSEICFSKHDNSPVTAYSNEDEAKLGADYVNREHNSNFTHYKCNKCNQWHLSPKHRNTQSAKCSYCTDRDGNNKDLYFTKKDAQQRADIIHEEQGIMLDLYKCKYQNGWHLTKG